MKFPGLFKSRYPDLKGKAWIKAIDPEDRKVFVDIGLQEMDHGRKGGLALVKKHGKQHMKKKATIYMSHLSLLTLVENWCLPTLDTLYNV